MEGVVVSGGWEGGEKGLCLLHGCVLQLSHLHHTRALETELACLCGEGGDGEG